MDVQDFIVNRDQHMRPLEYDLSENFNELVRYLNDVGVLDNVPVGVTAESEIASVSDAYPAPPRALTVYGKSTQNGTPTPDAPVEIVSVDALEVHASADGGTTDYTNWPVSSLLPTGTFISSLPDDKRDQLNLSYLRPSTREGWAWYSRKLVQKADSADMDALNWSYNASWNGYPAFYTSDLANVDVHTAHTRVANAWCSCMPVVSRNYIYANNKDGICISNGGSISLRCLNASSVEEVLTVFAGQKFVFELATPTTITLDPIELPKLPAPNATVWCDGGSATPTLVLEYVRDTNAAIAELSEAIADIVSG